MRLRSAATIVGLMCMPAFAASVARAGDSDKIPASVTVAFGAGLNTAMPNNMSNLHVIPQEVTVKITTAKKPDGTVVFVPATVNYIVSGFHQIWVYNPGVKVTDIVVPASGTFVNYDVNVFAKGVDPGTPPTFANASVNPSGVLNRTDSFGFSLPGRYLVICNVRGHFLAGMYAWVNVVDDDGNNGGHHSN